MMVLAEIASTTAKMPGLDERANAPSHLLQVGRITQIG
jgi:hypothetical protein